MQLNFQRDFLIILSFAMTAFDRFFIGNPRWISTAFSQWLIGSSKTSAKFTQKAFELQQKRSFIIDSRPPLQMKATLDMLKSGDEME